MCLNAVIGVPMATERQLFVRRGDRTWLVRLQIKAVAPAIGIDHAYGAPVHQRSDTAISILAVGDEKRKIGAPSPSWENLHIQSDR